MKSNFDLALRWSFWWSRVNGTPEDMDRYLSEQMGPKAPAHRSLGHQIASRWLSGPCGSSTYVDIEALIPDRAPVAAWVGIIQALQAKEKPPTIRRWMCTGRRMICVRCLEESPWCACKCNIGPTGTQHATLAELLELSQV